MKGNTKPAWKTKRKVQNNYDDNSDKEEKKKKIEAPDKELQPRTLHSLNPKLKLQRKMKKVLMMKIPPRKLYPKRKIRKFQMTKIAMMLKMQQSR